jgi:hypothetical protein
LVVALTGCRREVIQPFDLLGVQLDAVGAVFSSTRATRLVPGIGAMSSPCASYWVIGFPTTGFRSGVASRSYSFEQIPD